VRFDQFEEAFVMDIDEHFRYGQLVHSVGERLLWREFLGLGLVIFDSVFW
jgi:hypothetical protein